MGHVFMMASRRASLMFNTLILLILNAHFVFSQVEIQRLNCSVANCRELGLPLPDLDLSSDCSNLGDSLEESTDIEKSARLQDCQSPVCVNISSTGDELGLSLDELDCQSSACADSSSTGDELGLSLDELDCQSPACADSSSTGDELGLSLDELDCVQLESDNQESLNTNYENVLAIRRPPRKVESFLSSEVSCGKKMKSKALSLLSVKSALRGSCRCGNQCFDKVDFKVTRTLRGEFWVNSRTVRMQILKYYLSVSMKIGKFRFLTVGNGITLCSKAFLGIYGINKNTFSRAIEMNLKNVVSTKGKKPRDKSENTLLLITWLEDFATYHGDRMPNSKDILLPYRTVKMGVYMKYKLETRAALQNPVSRSQFFKTWEEYFPHLKVKKASTFSKCTVCTTIERYMEKRISVTERAEYRRLKDEHNERQMMERKYYYSKRENSRKDPSKYLSLIVDGMDQSKTNLPHFVGRRPKNINAADLLSTHVTGVISHGHSGFQTFVDIKEFPHDPNLTINVLLLMLKRTADANNGQLPSILYLQADNNFRENKNKYVLAFLELLVKEKIFSEVHLSFLIVGHTHEDVDAAFSKISENLRTTDAETLTDLLNMLPNCEIIKYIFDVKNWLKPHIANILHTSEAFHYKFTRVNNDVQVYFKGRYDKPWNPLEETILKSKPCGIPMLVKPDYSDINIERSIKQVESIKSMFIKSNSFSVWDNFYTELREGTRLSNAPELWILPELPRQLDYTTDNINVGMDVQELIDKENQIPRVHIRKPREKQSSGQAARPPAKRQKSGQAARPPAKRQKSGQAARPPAKRHKSGQAARPPAKRQKSRQAARPPAMRQNSGQAARPPAKRQKSDQTERSASSRQRGRGRISRKCRPKTSHMYQQYRVQITIGDDIKKHIWWKILMDILEERMLTVIMLLIFLTCIENFCLLEFMFFVNEIFIKLLLTHLGQFLATSQCPFIVSLSMHFKSTLLV